MNSRRCWRNGSPNYEPGVSDNCSVQQIGPSGAGYAERRCCRRVRDPISRKECGSTRVGAWSLGSGRRADGQVVATGTFTIDEAAVFSTALSGARIAAHHNTAANTWHYIARTRTNNTVTLYIDGKPDGTWTEPQLHQPFTYTSVGHASPSPAPAPSPWTKPPFTPPPSPPTASTLTAPTAGPDTTPQQPNPSPHRRRNGPLHAPLGTSATAQPPPATPPPTPGIYTTPSPPPTPTA